VEPTIVSFPDVGAGQEQPHQPPVAATSSATVPAAIPPPAVASPSQSGAGVGLLLAGTGVGVGLALGGVWGAIAGLFYAGALRNTVRAARTWAAPDPATRDEAVRSATVGVFGGFLAVIATLQVTQRGSAKEAS
jgi:predicted lipid-binding transport protein (Tim44 family)